MAKPKAVEADTLSEAANTVLGTINIMGDMSLSDVLIRAFEIIMPDFAKRVGRRVRGGEKPVVIEADIQVKGRARGNVDPVARDVLATAVFAYATMVEAQIEFKTQQEAEAYREAKQH